MTKCVFTFVIDPSQEDPRAWSRAASRADYAKRLPAKEGFRVRGETPTSSVKTLVPTPELVRACMQLRALSPTDVPFR